MEWQLLILTHNLRYWTSEKFYKSYTTMTCLRSRLRAMTSARRSTWTPMDWSTKVTTILPTLIPVLAWSRLDKEEASSISATQTWNVQLVEFGSVKCLDYLPCRFGFGWQESKNNLPNLAQKFDKPLTRANWNLNQIKLNLYCWSGLQFDWIGFDQIWNYF